MLESLLEQKRGGQVIKISDQLLAGSLGIYLYLIDLTYTPEETQLILNQPASANRSITANKEIHEARLRALALKEQLARVLKQSSWDTTSSLPLVNSLRILDFPIELKEALDKLQAGLDKEDILYDNASSIASWLLDNSENYQDTIAAYLQSMPPISRRVTIAALSDLEVNISSKTLLKFIASFLKSTDRVLAQIAATCLLTCGSDLGKMILKYAIDTEDLPHKRLIEGISKLLTKPCL